MAFKSENVTLLQKMVIYNFNYDDGLDFLMIYDYMDLVPESKISLKIISDAFSLEFNHEN